MLNPDDILQEILEKVGPNTNSIDNEASECLTCRVAGCNHDLSYPILPTTPFFTSTRDWFNTRVVPLMRKNNICFTCIVKWFMLSNTSQGTNFLDRALMHFILDNHMMFIQMPRACIHTDTDIRHPVVTEGNELNFE